MSYSKIRRTISARQRQSRIDKIQDQAHAIKDALLLEYIELYRQAMFQLDAIATLHEQQTVDVNLSTGKAIKPSTPTLDDAKFREEVVRVLEL